MGKQFFSIRCLAVLCSAIIMVGFVLAVPPKAISAQKVVNWNISVWGGKRAATVPLHDFVADMEKKTNGLWKIKIHYGAVLAPPKEQLDGIRAGMFEGAYFAPVYAPGKTYLHTVAELPFISPSKNKDISQIIIELWKHPAIKKELLKWNAVPLLPTPLPQYQLLGKKPLKTVEDFNGMRIRVGGEIARVLKKFGAVPTLMPAPEVYEAIARGTIDAVTFAWYAHGAYKIHEVSDYACNIAVGTLQMLLIANKDAYDALPEEFKKYHREWYNKSPEIWADQYQKADDKWLPIFKEKLDFSVFPTSERNKLIAKSEEVYEKWVKAREKEGLPGRDVLNYYLEKRKEITGK